MEIELKYTVPDRAAFEQLLAVTELGAYRLRQAGEKRLTDHYFDTPGRAVLHGGYAVRLREATGRWIGALKGVGGASGALHEREEYELDVPAGAAPAAWPASPARDRALQLTGQEPLAEILAIRQQRHKRLVLDGEREVAELSLDAVTFGQNSHEQLAYELEIELRPDGTRADLAALEAALGVYELAAQPKSKFERGLALADGAAQPSAGPYGGAPQPGVAEAATEDGVDGETWVVGDVLPATGTDPLPRAETVASASNESGPSPLGKIAVPAKVDGEPRLRAATAPPAADEDDLTPRAATAPSATHAGRHSPLPERVPTATEVDEVSLPAETAVPAADEAEFSPPAETAIPATDEDEFLPPAEAGRTTPAEGESTLLPETDIESTAPIDSEAAPQAEAESTPLAETVPAPEDEAADPSRPKSPGVTADEAMPEAGRKVLRFHFDRMVAQEAGVRQGDDIEAVHAMRVATRRQRAALGLFASYFKPKPIRRFKAALKIVGGRLGAVRDLDVQLAAARTYQASLSASAAAGLQPVVEAWAQERDEARVALMAHLDSRDYRSFKKAFRKFVGTEAAGVRAASSELPRASLVRQVLPSQLWKHYGALRAYEGVMPAADLTTLHALRITVKRVRYALEFFREVLEPASDGSIGDCIEAVVALQDHLGQLHDADVTLTRLHQFLQRDDESPLAPDAVIAVGAYLKVKQAELRHLQASAGRTWQRVGGGRFRRVLGKAVAAL